MENSKFPEEMTMKTVKRLFALILTLFVFLSLAALPASARAARSGAKYRTYTCIGDSIAAGVTLPGYVSKAHKEDEVTWPVIPGSFPAYVRDGVGATKVYMIAKPGYRTVEMRRVLDPSFKGDAVEIRHLPLNAKGTVDEAALKELRSGYKKAIQSSDLITIELGPNDIGQPILGIIRTIRTGEEDAAYIQGCLQAFSVCGITFRQNFGWLLNYIHKLNPNAKVVVTGIYNPVYNWALDTPVRMEYGRLLDGVIDLFNNYLKYESPYRSYYTYVDMNGVETLMFKETLFTTKFDAHPTPKGHREMARRILAALRG